MYLTLKNFRCYEEKTFEFGEKGLVLLSGASGKGKSTILMAIDFALFGNGTKLVSHGKKSCLVEFVFRNLKIVRKKGPNHLLVNDVYEDEAGEAVIRQVFGQIFNSVSYIPQNPRKTFVLLSPAERLDFLETFAFKDFDIVALKEKAKVIMKECNENLLKITGSIRYAVHLLEQKVKPENKPFWVAGVKKKETIEKYIQNEAVKLKNSVVILKNSEKKQKHISELIQAIDKLKMKCCEQEKTKLLLQQKRDELEAEKEKLEKEDSDVLLSELEKRLQNVLQRREIERVKKTLQENEEKLNRLIIKEEEEIKTRILCLEKEKEENPSIEEVKDQVEYFTCLLEKKKELEKVEKEVLVYEKDKDAEEKFKDVKKKIADVRVDLERAKLEKEKLHCPHCKGAVRFFSGTLSAFQEQKNSLQSIDQLQSNLAKLTLEEKTILSKLEYQKKYFLAVERKKELLLEIVEMDGEKETMKECEVQMQDFGDLLGKLESGEEEIKQLLCKLEKKQYSSTIVHIQKQLNLDKAKLQSRQEKEEKEEEGEKEGGEEDLRQKINVKKQVVYRREFLTKLLEKNNVDLQRVVKDLQNVEEEIKKYKPLSLLHEEEKEINGVINQHQKRKEELDIFFEKVFIWRQNQKEVEEYEKLLTDVEKLKTQEMEQKRKYTASCEFRDNILEAESIFVSNVIDNINNNVQLYLEHFFPDHPMTIRLSSFKENNKNETKPSIHLEIDYKGMEMELSMLSGGELSRVILSFTLAFADLYNSPLILLDECTSSLDQDLTSSVLEGLQEHFGSKLCLLVAHQVVKGTFDKVINL